MGGTFITDALDDCMAIDVVVVPDAQVDADEMRLAYERFDEAPKVHADWLRKTYLWMERMPYEQHKYSA